MLDPDLESFDNIKEQLKEQFHKAIEETQEKLGDDHFDLLIKSMEGHANENLEGKEWYTGQ